VVTCNTEGFLEESGIVACEVFKESSCDYPLSNNLGSALGHDSLDELDEVVFDFGLAHFRGDFQENFTELHIPAHVADGIVEPKCGDFLLRGHESVKLCLFGEWGIDDIAAVEGIEDG